MASVIKTLYDKGLANLGGHHWIASNVAYETMMGSVAYGVSSDTSDTDIYSFCIPPKDNLFPHLRGEIVGFGDAKHANNRFRNHQQHHIKDVGAEKEYDLNVYNIVDYFQLVMENNPNMIDSLFTPQFCVLHATRIGQMVRESRKLFLHRGSWHTFKGYAFAQMKKMKPGEELVCPECEQISTGWHAKDNKFEAAYSVILDLWTALKKDSLTDDDLEKYCFNCAKSRKVVVLEKQKVNRRVGKRKESVEKYGFDPKFAYHVVRLLGEIEQILTEGDIDLQRNREQLKAIRRGEWTLEQIESYFAMKEPQLEVLYNENRAGLPWGPKDGDLQNKVKQLLFHCLEEHYGNLSNCVVNPDKYQHAVNEIRKILDNVRDRG